MSEPPNYALADCFFGIFGFKRVQKSGKFMQHEQGESMNVGDKVRIKIGRGGFVGTVAQMGSESEPDKIGVEVEILGARKVVWRGASKVEKVDAEPAAA